jgi:hypothetical protein
MDFHDINRVGENHGGCDRRFAMMEMFIGSDEDFFAHVFSFFISFFVCFFPFYYYTIIFLKFSFEKLLDFRNTRT